MTDFRSSSSRLISTACGGTRSLTRRRPRFAVRPLALALAGGSLLSLLPGMTPNVQAQAVPPAGLPSGLAVVQGQVRAVTTGKDLTVTNSSGSILNWQSFSIGAGNAVTFVQPNAQSQVLNRVVGNDPSAILGSLSSNGKVWLLNPNGVLFGHGARIDVGGLVTSTLNLNDVDWLNGQSTGRFNLFGNSSASIVNQGELRSSLGGHIALLGGTVRNEGLIEAPNGQILLAAGKSIELIDTGSPNLRLRVTAPEGEALNLGTLQAANGRIDVHGAVVNQLGIVRADSLGTNAAGEIVLSASQALNLGAGSVTSASGATGGKISLDSGVQGTTMVSGEVRATGNAGLGGSVTLLGKNVGVIDSAKVDGSGSAGGGQVHVGGGERGQDRAYRNSDGVYIGRDASLIADATSHGDGGKIVLWANEATRAYGSFSARGGPLGGNGGFIETSGHWIDVSPARLDATATSGLAGTWLLDPWNLLITDAVDTIQVSPRPFTTFTAAVGSGAQIASADIRTALNNGNSVVITTGTTGTETGDITVRSANLAVAPNGPVSLTLQAARDILVTGSTISSTSAPLSLSLEAGTAGAGVVRVDLGTTIATRGGDVTMSGTGYNDPERRAGYAIAVDGAATSIDAGTGTVRLTGTSSTTFNGSGTSTVGVSFGASTVRAGRVDVTGSAISTSSLSGAAGVYFDLGASLTADTISITGTAQAPNSFDNGVLMFRSTLTATSSLRVSGTGNWTGVQACGLSESGGPTLAVTPLSANPSASLTINGTSTVAAAPSSNPGVLIDGLVTFSATNGAQVNLTGTNQGGAPALLLRNGVTINAGTGGNLALRGSNSAQVTATASAGGTIRIFADAVTIDGSFNSTAAGDAIVVAGSSGSNTSTFANNGGAGVFGTPGGRWLVYGQDAATLPSGGLPYDFRQYNARFGTANPLTPATGNGLLYATAPSITATGSGINKTYDGSTATGVIPSAALGFSGLVAGDVATLSSAASGNYVNKDAGNDKLITLTSSAVTVAGSDGKPVYGYGLTSNVTGNILPKGISLGTVSAANKAYDGGTLATVTLGTLNGLVGSETLTVTGNGNFDTKNVGTGKTVTVSAILGNGSNGGLSANYLLTSTATTTTANITAKRVSFGTITAANKTYDGGTLATLTLGTLNGLVGSETLNVSASGNFDTKDAGNGKTVTVNGTLANGSNGGLASNYVLAPALTTTADITQKTLTLRGLSAANKVYDGNTTASVTLGGLSGLVGTETLGATTSGNFDTKDAGAAKTVTVGVTLANGSNGGLASNYRVAPTTTTTADITPKTLTLSGLSAANKVYDGNTTASVSLAGLSGLVGNETLGNTASGSFDTKDTGTSKTVTVGVTLANGSNGGLASNYRLAPTATTTADITPKGLTVTANDANKTYGNSLTFNGNEFTSSGLVGSETIGSVSLSSTGAPASASVAAGPYPIVASNAVGGSFSIANYNVRYVNGTLSVNPAALNAVLASIVGNPTKAYDGTTSATLVASNFSLSGFYGTDGATVSKTSGTYSSADVGSRTVSTTLATGDFNPVGSTDLRNYTLPTTASGTGTITRKSLTLTGVAANSKTYDGTTVASLSSSGTLSGLVGGQTLTLSNTGASFDTKDAGTAKTVTMAGITLGDGTGLASNYRVSGSATTTADINPKNLTLAGLAAANKVYDGNTTASVALGGLTGLVGNETLGTTTNGSFDTKDAGIAKTVTVGVTLANGSNGGLASNYRLAPSASTTADITPKALTVSSISAANKVYDGNTIASVTLGGLTGLVGNETLATAANGSFDTKDAGNAKTVTVGVTLANGSNGGLANNYRVAPTTTTTADITQKTLTLSGLGATNKVYDGTTLASVTTGPLNGLVGNETLGVSTTSAQFDTKDVGTAKQVTVAGIGLSNGTGLASNYRVAASATTSADITPAPLTITANNAAKTFGDTLNFSGTEFTSTALAGTETLSSVGLASAGAAATASVAGGPYAITASNAIGSGFDARNYDVRYVNGSLTVNPANLSAVMINIVGNPTKAYDGTTVATLTSANFGLTGFIGSDAATITQTSGRYDSANAGSRTVTVNLARTDYAAAGTTDLRNYALPVVASGSGTIVPRTVTASGGVAANKAYDGNTAATVTGVSLSGLVGNETLAVASASARFDTKDAGTGKTVTVTGITLANGTGRASNYALSGTTASTTADITPKALTVTASNASKTFGTSLGFAGNEFVAAGLVGSETIGSVGLNSTGAAASASVAGGPYAIVASNAGGGSFSIANYNVSYVNGTLTVNPAELNAVLASIVGNPTKVYDGTAIATLSASNFGLSGFVGSDSATITKTAGTYSSADAGSRTVSTTLANGDFNPVGSTDLRNYTLPTTASGAGTITQKTVTLTGVTASNKLYDGSTAASLSSTGTLAGLVGGQALTVSTAGANFDTKDAGTGKIVTVGGIALANGTGLASNYRIAPIATTTADITPKTLTLSGLSADSKTYDGNTTANVTLGGLSGLVGTETLGTSLSGSFDTKDAGTAKTVTVGTTLANGSNGGLARNYRIGPSNTTANVTPATLTYTASQANKIVGAPTPVLSGAVSGFVANETLASATTGSLGFVTPATATSPAGSYAVDGAGLAATNYRFVQAPGNASALTVTGLEPQQIDEGSKSALGLTLATVAPKKEWSSPDEGRVFDAVQAMQAAVFGQLLLFNAVPVGNMSFDSLSALLASRDRYKKALFADAIHQLELDPSLADARACTSIADAESGSCLITEKIKEEIRAQRVAQADALAAAAAAAARPAPAAPGAATAAAPAPETPAPKPATPAVRQAAPLLSFLRRNVRTASLPQIERKIAVVIGTNQYADKSIPQLENAVGDAQAVGKLLESTLGYETIVLTNSSKQSVVRTLNRLAVEVGPKDSVVVYYAGHGELIESTGLGYWQLADSDAKKPETWLSNADISRLVKQIGASQVALISDSCYSGSLVDERIRASGTQTDPRQLLERKTVVVMSSGGNEPVFDAGKDGHSPFAYNLMSNLRQVTSWQAGGNVFERVRFAVARELPQRPHYGAAAAAGHQSGGDYLFEQRQLEAIP